MGGCVMVGRPTVYTAELGLAVCELLTDGLTLRRICRENPEFPDERTIRRWAMDVDHPFSPQYAKAREIGYHTLADEIVDISDDNTRDTYETEEGREIVAHDVVARARLRVDTRKWLLSKALPKVYGDKIEHAHSGEVNVRNVWQALSERGKDKARQQPAEAA